jgi:hypothetical protein
MESTPRMVEVFAETTEPEPLYQVLPPETVRLLELQPFSDLTEPLQCSLQAIAFPNAQSKDTPVPYYEVLSYTWAIPSSPTHSSAIAAHFSSHPLSPPFSTTCASQTTHESYGVMQSASTKPPTKTKSSRSSQMRNIYARACRVIIWLGPEDETTPALEMLDRALKEAQQETRLPIPNFKHIKG